MRGQIITKTNRLNNSEYGFIKGEDGDSYFFDQKSMLKGNKIQDFNIRDNVEFDLVYQEERGYFKAVQVTLVESKQNIQKQAESPIKFYKKGYYSHINRSRMISEHLKQNSGELEILDKLSELLYITHVNHHDMGPGVLYPFCLIGATEFLKQYIRGQYEFLLIFSHFDNETWQQNTLKAVYHIRHRKEIADRRPLVNFHLLISNAKDLKKEIDKMKGGTDAAIIPFTFSEILNTQSKEELSKLILSRFDEYFFENNMLGEENPIEEDTLLFGDRGKIADSIVQRCIEKKHSGIFGLRRSGKSSVLRAVTRRLNQNFIKYIVVQARSGLESASSWQMALYDIAREIRIVTSGVFQHDGESRKDFDIRLGLSSTEEDYAKRATKCFVEDVQLYIKDEQCFVIAIDEVELITYNTATSAMWQSLDSYKFFWGALRDAGCSLILCGVNSTINEKSTISYKNNICDNPMYERIQNCVGFSKTYLPAFTDEQTKEMINTLGGYSNISFSKICTDINRAFGGQPYAIRQFCSYIFENIKQYRKHGELYEVSKATFNALIEQFNGSREGFDLYDTMLQHIQIYSEEYDTLKNLALSPEKNRRIEDKDISIIDHLEKYGLIEYDRQTHFVTFNIESIQNYICRIASKKPENMSNEERRHYIQDKVKLCEEKLKQYLQNLFTYNKSINARNILKGYFNAGKLLINSKAQVKPNPDTCPIKDFFNHKLFIMYFSMIKKIIQDNWPYCKHDFESVGIMKNNFSTFMEQLNAGRNDADHYDPINSSSCPDDWEISDETLQEFMVAFNKMNSFFCELGL